MWGFQLLNNGVETLGMGDFTMRKIHEEVVPAASGPWVRNASINEPYLITVPGYVASQCYVVITPKVYSAGEQTAASNVNALRTPVYVDMGGEVIGIIRYANERWYDYANQLYRDSYRWCAVESVVEVFRVYGG